jgi:hypothetical protein
MLAAMLGLVPVPGNPRRPSAPRRAASFPKNGGKDLNYLYPGI